MCGDATVRALTEKVAVHEDNALSAAFPDIQAAIVTIRLKDGRQLSARVDYPKGEPENPLSDAEFRSRYDGLMAYAGIVPADSAAVFEAVVPPRRRDGGRYSQTSVRRQEWKT